MRMRIHCNSAQPGNECRFSPYLLSMLRNMNLNRISTVIHSRVLWLLLCVWLGASCLSGATYYIDPANGDNDATGLSDAQAWKTFRNIFTYRGDRRPAYYRQLAAGDTVYVMNGTISEIHRPGDDKGAADVTGRPSLMRIDGDDLVSNGGNQAEPIRILAYPGHHPLLDAGYQGDCIVLEHANWIEIAGLRMSRGAGGEGGGIKIGGCSDISIHDCEVFDNAGRDNDNCSGLNCGGTKNVRIYDCVFHDNYDREAADTGGISTWNSTNMVFFSCTGSIEIHDCLIYQTPASDNATNSGAGIKYKHSTQDPSSTFEVHRNIFRNCKFFSFQSGSANTHFHHNIIIGGNAAISTQDCGGTTHQVNQIFEYNTIYRPLNAGTPTRIAPAFSYHPTTSWRNDLFPSDPQNVVFRHNIVCDNGTYSTENAPITVNPYITDALYAAAIPELFVDHNTYFSGSGTAFRASLAASTGYGGPLYGGYYTWEEWRALAWTDPDTGHTRSLNYDQSSVLADPGFSAIDLELAAYDPASQAFRPTQPSAVNKGAYAGLGNTPPVLSPVGSRSVSAGQQIQITVQGSDADGDPLQYSATGGQ